MILPCPAPWALEPREALAAKDGVNVGQRDRMTHLSPSIDAVCRKIALQAAGHDA